MLYVLDEPSIGLHQRDNARLLATLKRLRDLGNSVLVVEHDEEAMREAYHLIDLGRRGPARDARAMRCDQPSLGRLFAVAMEAIRAEEKRLIGAAGRTAQAKLPADAEQLFQAQRSGNRAKDLKLHTDQVEAAEWDVEVRYRGDAAYRADLCAGDSHLGSS